MANGSTQKRKKKENVFFFLFTFQEILDAVVEAFHFLRDIA